MRHLTTVVAGLVAAATFSVVTLAQQPAPGRWLVQVWFDAGSISAGEGEDLGRVEVAAEDGRFVGCVLASSVKTQYGETFVTPISVGFATDVDPGKVKVGVEGEMRRLGVPKTKVTKIQ